jgi:hypothetical protein
MRNQLPYALAAGVIFFVGFVLLGVPEHSVSIGLAAALAVGAAGGLFVSRARRGRRG